MGLADINIDVGGVLTGIGTLAKDIRAAITGESVLDPNKKAELLMKVQELEFEIQKGTISVAQAEAASQDRWTSRARPAFMYVIYILILAALPFAAFTVINEGNALKYVQGFQNWLNAIPTDLYALFGAGYLGYGAFRSYDKKANVCK